MGYYWRVRSRFLVIDGAVCARGKFLLRVWDFVYCELVMEAVIGLEYCLICEVLARRSESNF